MFRASSAHLQEDIVVYKQHMGTVTLYKSPGGLLTLNLPTTTIVAQPFNVIKWQLKFNPVA